MSTRSRQTRLAKLLYGLSPGPWSGLAWPLWVAGGSESGTGAQEAVSLSAADHSPGQPHFMSPGESHPHHRGHH